jgi:17beta-estradiol 17-dehydrogenase / very-long-chain 3-oxoacyl-CoA reductase
VLACRQKGAIINVSSGSGNHPTPLLSTYAATKAFINEFSRSIHYEAKEAGVDVLCVTPYYVSSNMYKKEPGFMVASARRVVRDTLALVGRYDIAAPYFWHALQGWLFDSYWATPQALMKSLKRNRDRALKMKARSAANSPAAASAAQSTSGA